MINDRFTTAKDSRGPAPLMKNGIIYKQSAELADAGGGPRDQGGTCSAACVAIARSTTAASIAK